MAALWNMAGHYSFALWFFLSSSFYIFSLPNLSRPRLDVYHTCTHEVALVRIYDADLKCAERGSLKYRTQKIAKNSPSGLHRTTLSAVSSQLRHLSTIGKKLLNSNTSFTCSHNMVNFGPLTAEIGLPVWGTPANFNGFHVFAELLHGTVVVGVSQTLRH